MLRELAMYVVDGNQTLTALLKVADHPAVLQKPYVPRDLTRAIHVVGDHEDCGPLLRERHDKLIELIDRNGIEPRSRLVQ